MLTEIYNALDRLLANQDYHHFDSVCYVGVKHNLGIYFMIFISILQYMHQTQTIMTGISFMRMKKIWPLMKNDNVCSFFLTLISTYPLLLDIHLLRMHLFIGLIIYAIDKTTSIVQKLPYLRMSMFDIGFLLFVEILHLLCFTTFYKVCKITIEFIRTISWLFIVTYRQQHKTQILLYSSVGLQFFWCYIFFFKQ